MVSFKYMGAMVVWNKGARWYHSRMTGLRTDGMVRKGRGFKGTEALLAFEYMAWVCMRAVAIAVAFGV